MSVGNKSSTNRGVLRVSDPEVTYTTPPGGTYFEVPLNSESFQQNNASNRDETISQDGRTQGTYRTGIEVPARIQSNYRHGVFEPLMADALLSAGFSTPPADIGASTIAFESKATSPTVNARILEPGGALNPIPLYALIHVADAGGVNDDLVCKVLAKPDANTLEVLVQRRLPAMDLVDAAAGAAITIRQFSQAVDGTTCRTRTVEREQTDALTASQFAQFVGCLFGGVTIEGTLDGAMTIELDVLGSNEVTPAPTVTNAAAVTAVPANRVFDGKTTNGVVSLDGELVDWTRWRVSHANNAELVQSGGVEAAVGAAVGAKTTEANFEIYHGANPNLVTVANQFNQTNALISMKSRDATPRFLVIDLPNGTFGSAGRPINAPNQRIIQTHPMTVEESVAQDTQIRIAVL